MGSLPFQSDMGSGKKVIHLSFTEVKRNLNPAFSYMVFERSTGSDESWDFSYVFRILSRLKRKAVENKIYQDQTTGSRLLIVKMEPKETEGIMQEIFEIGLPKDFTYYVYWSLLKDQAKQGS